MVSIGIVSFQLDAHGWLVKKAIEDRRRVRCHLVAADTIASHGGITWSHDGSLANRIRDAESRVFEPASLDVMWFRRMTNHQVIPEEIIDPKTVDFIRTECMGSLKGFLLSEFRGTWISHPDATLTAGNSLVQLRAAKAAGFRVPRTLVSQVPEDIRRFAKELDHQVIVKDVHGTSELATATTVLKPELLEQDEVMSLCPAIYQELIPGQRHLRVLALGDRVISALLEAEELDWRYKDRFPIREHALDSLTEKRIAAVLRILGLRMGVFDFKLADDGEPAWLEVNPQGQFLWVESEGGVRLLDPFVDFLVEEAKASHQAGQGAEALRREAAVAC
ncbi:MAG: hypothetical protein HY698_15330 [Deltaproteobacteria bacterium]|nr:hypothetical protein [Deltaproteobacteria bacterium]